MVDYRYLGNGSLNSVSKINTDSPYSIAVGDYQILANASAGNLTLTLPTAAGVTGKAYVVRRVDITESANLVTIATTSSQTISGGSNDYLFPGDWLIVESDGSNWQTVARTPGSPSYLKGSTANRRYVAGSVLGMTPVLVTSTTAPALDTLWALPLIVTNTTKFDLISFRLTTNASAGGIARVGIYRDSNCYPGALIFESGNIDTTTGALKDTTITSSLQVFSPGTYWLAWQCRVAAPQLKVLNGVNQMATILGSDALSNNNSAWGYSVANAADALPNPFTAAATLLFSTPPSPTAPIPAIGLRPI